MYFLPFAFAVVHLSMFSYIKCLKLRQSLLQLLKFISFNISNASPSTSTIEVAAVDLQEDERRRLSEPKALTNSPDPGYLQNI